MKKRYWLLAGLLVIVLVTFFTGPKIPKPTYNFELPKLPVELADLEKDVEKSEARKPVREDNQARILWYNDSMKVSEYSIVYLHGFAGSYRDGYPVNVNIADSLKANIYLSRWAGHGLKPEAALKDFSAESAWESAKRALEIGKKIGDKVIIMSTSTGGTLALKLAATYPDSVFALINMAPNIEDDMEGAFILNSPWGYEIANLVSLGAEKKIEHEEEIAAQYWDTVYPSKALVDLQVLVSTTMNKETFSNIEVPVLTLYYHDNILKEDEHVEVDDFKSMHKALGTRDSLKKLVALAEPETHFIGSGIKSKNTQVVEREILDFLTRVLKIKLK